MTTPLADARRVVVKIGSSLLTNAGAGLDRNAIADWARQIGELRARGLEVLVVSSGAIAEGMKRLGWKRRPRAVNELQAAAAVGQMGLVQMWESCFAEMGLHTAQVLLTHEDLGDRRRYLNARTTLRTTSPCAEGIAIMSSETPCCSTMVLMALRGPIIGSSSNM